MKCFNHLENDAVGICKSCGKGLCSQCVVEIGQGLACVNSCENDVESINYMSDESERMLEEMLRNTQTTDSKLTKHSNPFFNYRTNKKANSSQ